MASPDAQYVIDIAAGMREGEHTARELDRLTDQLVQGGRQADNFDGALASLDSQLRRAQEAAARAAGELSEHAAQYRVLERAANRTARAVERAGPRATEKQINAAKEARVALDQYAGRLQRVERAAHETAQAESALARQHANVARLSKRVDDRLGDSARSVSVFRGALGDIGGPLGEFAEGLVKPAQAYVDLNEQFGRASAATMVGVGLYARAATTLVTLAGAAGIATAAMTAFAVVQSDNRKQAELTLQALGALHPELAGVTGQFGEIADRTGVATEAVQKLALDLERAGVSAKDMPQALEAAAKAESALGAGGASKFIADLEAGRTTVDRFAYDVETKFGGIVEERLKGLGAITGRFKRNIGGLFDDVEAGPALAALDRLAGLFDENSESGRAMRAVLGQLFNPLIEGADKVERFLLGFAIGLTKDYLTLKETFRDTPFGPMLDQLGDVSDWGETLSVVVSAAAGTLAILAAVVLSVPAAFYGLYKAGEAVWDFFAGLDWGEIGSDILQGIARGITGQASAVKRALIGAAREGVDGLKSFLGIASPSKVLAEDVGAPMGQGVAVGVESEGERVKRALESISNPPLALAGANVSPLAIAGASGGGDASGGGGGRAGGGGGTRLDFAGANFNFYGMSDGASAADSFRDRLTDLLEGDASSLGAA